MGAFVATLLYCATVTLVWYSAAAAALLMEVCNVRLNALDELISTRSYLSYTRSLLLSTMGSSNFSYTTFLKIQYPEFE